MVFWFILVHFLSTKNYDLNFVAVSILGLVVVVCPFVVLGNVSAITPDPLLIALVCLINFEAWKSGYYERREGACLYKFELERDMFTCSYQIVGRHEFAT
ncbi:uncharacterized protein LOC141612465 isoform X3 [Silene latifolia]|uniref:uncharacterized protein LOC141612465 isoform X3 n=1 Tax=Silene latifolia TaxID=37657 RepID=UPI003D785109